MLKWWQSDESRSFCCFLKKSSSHVSPMFLPSKSQVSPIFCMREMGGKREVEVREKECWRGNRDYYAFRDGYFLSPEVTSI